MIVEVEDREKAALHTQLAAALATIAMLTSEIAKLNDRVAELLAIAQRKQRKPAAPGEKKPEPPPVVEAAAQHAFDARPTPPVLPEKTKTKKAQRRTGRMPIPPHLEPEEHRQPRPSQCEHCGGRKLGIVDEVIEEKLHVVKEHQRRRIVTGTPRPQRDCSAGIGYLTR